MRKEVRILVIFAFITLLFTNAAAAQSTSAADFYKLGRSLQLAQDWAGAVEQYQEALRLNPSYADVWFALSECAYSMGEYSLALTYIESASKFLKNNSALQNLQGFSLIGLARLEEARAVFLSVLASYPNDVDARFGLAELDIFNGRISGAEKYYKDALSRQSQNKKALLSLALISYELGNTQGAKEFIEQALMYHNGESEVHYFASYIAVKDGNLSEAENHCRNAVYLSPSDDKSLELLSLILYSRKKYSEAMEICSRRISLNRNTSLAWYVKAKILEKQGNIEEALQSYKAGLEIKMDDELMRTSMENLINNSIAIEDPRRSNWASAHIKNAKEAIGLFLSDRASYEYKRALRISPLDSDVRLLYADLLLQDKKYESYLSQLQFIKAQGAAGKKIDDTIESYNSLLRNTLPVKWNIDPLYLDKTRYSIGLYFTAQKVQLLHPDSVPVTAQLLRETFQSEGFLSVITKSEPVTGYAEAFRQSRTASLDYFALIDFEETERDVLLTLTLYSAKTGSEVQTFSVYRTGNLRYSLAVQKIVESVTKAFPQRGKILARSASTVLIDLGKNDGAAAETVFTIVESGKLIPHDSQIALTYSPSSVLGTVTITEAGEDISQGMVKQLGFYDRINIGDELVSAVDKESETEVPVSEPSVRTPALIELLKLIR
ncbi:MAG TPA: tetratricopeptide repeat protein [Treponemataceae bacterium]|nr:tetratricopeptide repeat protein [Treponemataceae bacterium]